ncbi:type VI secretion system Vgr family protein [Paraburkholderia sp.]|uniref:type VI secretion system Vgr family protein n=1 Tax=Paraburkholderia sp. TaxID=1926495 RepID=UPI002D63A1E1|nr:type VI secretion system tip protein TssI/VgrG [Paraburkholderia sp.]HZZ06629.1 type VI secretion system tip protein TssI/VgrG [Paraburkholderia sp.]
MFKPVQPRTLAISGSSLPTWGGNPILTAQRLSGTEKLGRLYEYTVDLMTVDKPTLGLWQAKELVSSDALVGKELTASIEFEGKGTFIPGALGTSGGANIGAGRREITGLITEVCCTGEDDRHAYYRFTVRPWLWLATLNRENRIFQNQSVVEISESILNEERYGFPHELRLAGPVHSGVYPKRDYVRQIWESDFQFLRRLWREWGLYFFMDGATLILCDSPGSHKRHGPAYETISYHAPDGKRIDEEHIHKLTVSRELTAGSVSLTDYDYTRSRANLGARVDDASDITFANAEHYGWGDYSQPLASAMGLSGDPNNVQQEAQHLARVRLDGERCRGLRAHGKGNLRGLATGFTFHLENHPVKQANAEYLVVSTTVDIRNVDETSRPFGDGARYQCETEFALQPADTFFKNRLKKKPRCVNETAIVVGPSNQPMWVDGYARIKVGFIWDRLGNNDQNSSCWVRVSSPWQGDGFGTIYLPRIGQEITVNYQDDDPDRPYVSDRMVNQFNQPPWTLPDNQALSGTRTQEINGGMSNSFVADDTTGKPQVQVTSDYAQSRLVLGYNTRIAGNAGRKEARGEGVELATDAEAVMRAGRGMLITTEARHGADAPVKDMGETMRRLTQAREQHEDLAKLAQQHKAQQIGADQNDVTQDIKAQNDAIRGEVKTDGNPFPQLERPDMVFASAAGFGFTSVQSTHLASQQDVAITTGRDVSISSGRSFLASVRGAVSFFAAQFGIRLFAARGRVDIQAQSDDMALAALKDLTISSTDGRIIITASKEVWIGAQGSYIRINGEGIENGTPGKILEKCASWNKPGPTSMRMPLPDMPGEKSYSAQFTVRDRSGATLRNYPYRLEAENGPTWYGVTDENGLTQRVWTTSSQNIKLHPHEAQQPASEEIGDNDDCCAAPRSIQEKNG